MGDDCVYSYSQYVLKKSQKYFDNEGAVLSQYDVNGYEAQVVTYHAKSDIYVVWNDGEYVYALSSFALSVDELLEVARSVQAVPNP